MAHNLTALTSYQAFYKQRFEALDPAEIDRLFKYDNPLDAAPIETVLTQKLTTVHYGRRQACSRNGRHRGDVATDNALRQQDGPTGCARS